MTLSLDIGCGHAPRHQRQKGIGIDLKKGLCDIQASAYYLPFRNGVFKKVEMNSVLEHLINPGIALDEIKRVLAKKGILTIEVPNPSTFWIFKDYVFSRKAKLGNTGGSIEHVNAYGEAELQNLMRIKGFRTTKIEYVISHYTKKRMAHYDLLRKIFYMALFRLFPAFRTALKLFAIKKGGSE